MGRVVLGGGNLRLVCFHKVQICVVWRGQENGETEGWKRERETDRERGRWRDREKTLDSRPESTFVTDLCMHFVTDIECVVKVNG